MSMLRRSLVDLSRPLARSIKTDAVKNARPFRPHSKAEALPRSFEQGSSSGAEKAMHEPTPVEHLKHRERMKARFPDGWNPPRKLSREAMNGLRTLHAHDPSTFTTPVLAERFRVSPEAVRRILKSKWMPSREEKAKLQERERRRKQENIVKRVDRERAAKWAQFDSQQEEQREKCRERDDGFTLV